jgi:hypothetical protein
MSKPIHQIAVETVDKIEPGLQKSIDNFADSKNMEIKYGRDGLIRHRDKLIAIVESALNEAIQQK